MVEDIQPRESDQRALKKQRAVEQLVRAFQDAVVPTQQSLDTMMDRARAFRVIRVGGAAHHRPIGEGILLESRAEKMLADLRHFLQIARAETNGSCFCHGDPCIEFLDESGVRIAEIGLKHRRFLRWSAWGFDAPLVDGFGLMKWLRVNGVTDWDRERARKVARAVWDGQTAVLEAVHQLYSLVGAIDDETDRALILAFKSEIPYVPIGDVRQLWAPYALRMKDEELVRVEVQWKKGFLEACKKIAEA